MPKDIFGIIVYWFSQAEQQDYNRDFIPGLTPRFLGFEQQAAIPKSGFFHRIHIFILQRVF